MTKQNQTKKNQNPIRLWVYAACIICVWSLFLFFSWLWIVQSSRSGTLETIKIDARNAFKNDILYRRWNTGHGGVYVPITPQTQPNPYLKTEHREIKAPGGITLTKINPAYMTRQVHELAAQSHGRKSHITSLNPIRPLNAPDPWETLALKRFEKGETEVSSIEKIDQTDHLRLMGPLVTEKGCLVCHEEQGYKEGEIRGGISISIPLAPYLAIEKARTNTMSLVYGILWAMGVGGTLASMYLLNRQIQRLQKAEARLLQNERMEGVVEMAGAVCHELNQPLQMILGNAEIMLLDLEPDHPVSERIRRIQEQVKRMAKTTRNLIKITNYETKQFPQGKVIDIEKASTTLPRAPDRQIGSD
ncbi:MAG: DUF3365 domain-containing protein [Proteobacteria bacterium]|nr:DUF3365 domain-containing protein [Desulfobacula sp.]MBU4132193.1 DUF3365 domain-containing protein [Pseudomonadota bacterium]